jgi:hypothetical protein
VLPADWVDDATSVHSDNSAFDSTAEWQQGYGYQFWLGTHGYRADGAFGQYCVVLPEADAVLAITGSMAELPMPLYPVWDGLLPALADDPLPEAPAAVTAMHEALARLSVPAPQGVRATEAARRVFGARFGLDQNAHGFETLELRPDDEGATLMLSVAGRDEAIGIGHRQWRRSAVELWPGEGLGIAARGGWVGEREFQARIVSTTSPTAVNLTLQFPNDDTVELTLREHVSFNPIVPLVVGGTRAS